MSRLLTTSAAGLLGTALLFGAASTHVEAAPRPDGSADARAEALEVEKAVTRMRAKAITTTVLIRAVIPTGREDIAGFGSGSGVLISEDGEVLTCAHVVDMEGAQLSVRLSDGRRFPAKLLGKHSKHDYALIKIQAPGAPAFPVAPLGDSDAVRRGAWGVAMGHPLRPNRDNQPTVSVGRIRSVSAKLQADRGRRQYKDVLMHDAPLFSGNSGGPLFDLHGRIVGVNAAITLNNQNGYAVPIERIRRNLAMLRRGIDIEAELPKARVTRGGTLSGIRTAPIDEQAADYMRLAYGLGEFVATVLPGSLAQRGGLQRLDVILEVNAAPLHTGRLRDVIAELPPGEKVKLTVLRLREGSGNGYHRVTLTVALDRRR